MLRASILFFLIGLGAMFLGFYNVAGVSFDVGRLMLLVFLGLAVLSFIGSLIGRRRLGPPV